MHVGGVQVNAVLRHAPATRHYLGADEKHVRVPNAMHDVVTLVIARHRITGCQCDGGYVHAACQVNVGDTASRLTERSFANGVLIDCNTWRCSCTAPSRMHESLLQHMVLFAVDGT